MIKYIEDSTHTAAGLGSLYFPSMFPPNMNTPEFDGSLGLRHIERPHLVYIARPNNAYTGQLLELYSNGGHLPVSHTFIREDDPPWALIPLLLPPASIQPSAIDPLECRINHTSEFSLPLRLRVDLQLPAGWDPDPGTPDHQGLNVLLPPDILYEGLSESKALAGVDVTVLSYQGMAKNDRMLLYWGDQPVYHWVTEQQVGKFVHIHVPYDVIMQARDSAQFRVTLQVLGHTGNYMDPAARWSAATRVDVHVHLDPLEAPVLDEADPRTHVIDLEQLNGRAVICHVYPSRTYYEVNDIVHFYGQGTDARGNVLTYYEKQTVLRTGLSMRFSLPNDWLLDLAQGLVTARYVLEKHDSAQLVFSKAEYASVKGPLLQWPAPQLNGTIVHGKLSLEDTGSTVSVPFHQSWRPADLISLVWVLPDPHGPVEYRYSRSAGDRPPNGMLVFELPDAEIKRFEGRASQLYYEARDFAGNHSNLGESLRLTLMVGDPWLPMTAPVVERAAGHELEVSQAPDGVDVILHGVPASNLATLYWVGPVASIILRSYPGIPAQEQRRLHVPERFVRENLGKTVKLYWATRSDGKPERYSQVSTLRIVNGARP